MDIALWMLIGAAAGWASYEKLGMNEERGMKIAAAIGAGGGLLGGMVVAPLFVAAPPADPGMTPLVFAAATAAVLLYLGNVVEKRWGV